VDLDDAQCTTTTNSVRLKSGYIQQRPPLRHIRLILWGLTFLTAGDSIMMKSPMPYHTHVRMILGLGVKDAVEL
jgi:hypothetical protein